MKYERVSVSFIHHCHTCTDDNRTAADSSQMRDALFQPITPPEGEMPVVEEVVETVDARCKFVMEMMIKDSFVNTIASDNWRLRLSSMLVVGAKSF